MRRKVEGVAGEKGVESEVQKREAKESPILKTKGRQPGVFWGLYSGTKVNSARHRLLKIANALVVAVADTSTRAAVWSEGVQEFEDLGAVG